MIAFHFADLSFHFINRNKIKQWIKNTAIAEGKTIADLNIIFTSDSYLLDLNRKFLSHDTYTDIITFPITTRDGIGGELYISVDRVKENATNFGSLFIDELHRVIIHGVLHLCGLNDSTAAEKDQIRASEDKYLSLRSF